MNETGTMLRMAAVRDGHEPIKPLANRALFLTASLTLLGAIILCCAYFQASHSLNGPSNSEVLTAGRVEAALLVVGVGGAVGVGLVFIALLRWGKAWREQLQKAYEREEQWRIKAVSFEQRASDSHRKQETLEKAEEEARAQVAELTRARAALQEELDKRKQAEKAYSQQRQSLESSKTVLELNVQARKVELINLQRRYELILNAAGEGICGLDLQGKATFVNPAVARMTGWSIEELSGRTEQELFHPQGPAKEDQGELVFHRKGGDPFPVEYVRTHIEEDGRQTGSVLIFKDITQRKRTEETLAQKAAELTRSNLELEQFAFVASHDLQEPLRKIQAFGDRLKVKADKALTSDARDYLERMQRASARMRTLIDDLLAFSRVIRSGEPFVPVNLAQTAREVVGDLELRIEKTGADVQIGDLPTIQADPTQMRQLLLNLIGNALKFQAPGNQPVVTITAAKVTTGSGELFWDLIVQDNGIGFEEQYAEKIFAVFERLHGRDEYEGTGIGLAVCRRITDRHSGTITAKGQLEKGATFIITLPARQNRNIP
jgi:PAS domain S-box-containing protein